MSANGGPDVRRPNLRGVDWSRESLLGLVADAELARKHGVAVRAVRTARWRRGIKSQWREMALDGLCGQRFGLWEVVRRMPGDGDWDGKRKRARLLARCACGVERAVLRDHLVHGRSLSCVGCSRVRVPDQLARGIPVLVCAYRASGVANPDAEAVLEWMRLLAGRREERKR